MRPLFGNIGGDSSSSKNLVEFRAGKMHLRGTTVTADKRKGQLYIHQSDDSLMHFCWKDRTTGIVEDDLIIFPDDAEYKKVPQCTTGRAFVLRFKLSRRKFFFWMQEPKDDKDEDFCKKINDLLNNPPAPGSTGTASGLPPGLSSLGDQLGDSGLQSLLSSMDQNQIMQLLNGTGLGESTLRPTTAASNTGTSRPETQASTTSAASKESSSKPTSKPQSSAAAVPKSASPAVQLSDLQSILANMNSQQESQDPVDLSMSINTESLAPLLADSDVRKRLSEFLPEVGELTNSENEIKETIQSPQFRQALSSFSAALQSGQLAPLIQQFGLGPEATQAATTGDIMAFVKALQNLDDKKSSESQEDHDMAKVD
ncbi:proteasomal ubiquitin receptor ADRM1-like [Rhopilema esculentum]|uniref:proteasomal ubiquitin receptor ADRM1-like n=1 Tax=Rhopilema esculentum TaxID=499914 RepID=UPI0031DF8CD3|eukprot:gene8262-14211_t